MIIYPIDLNDFSRKYIVIKSPDMSLEYIIKQFLKLSGMDPAKYAGKLFSSILTNFFYEIEDLEHLYEKFYLLEYDSFEDYLYKKMLIDKEEIDFLIPNQKEGEKLYFADLGHTVSNNYENLFEYEEENLLLKINDVLEVIK